MEKARKFETVNIYGCVYISRDEIARFEQGATAGEFAKRHQIPQRASRKDGAHK